MSLKEADYSRSQRSWNYLIRTVKWTISVGIVVTIFLQHAGKIVNDTKLDIAIAPSTFLKHATSMWDPLANFGCVPFQAFGYFFPMGPFFLLGHELHLSTWIIQRAWVSALFLFAFWGICILAKELDIGNPASQILAAMVYILSPALTSLGSFSAFILPFSVVPWVLIPLIRGSRGGSARRAGALSGLAILFIGGANGALAAVILPLPVLWLLSRSPGPRRRSLTFWFLLSTILACTWWFIPLELQGHYGFNPIKYTELPVVINAITSVFEALRGTAFWLSFDHIGSTALQSGWNSVTSEPFIAASIFLTGIGLFGLGKSSLKERNWLISCFILGVVFICSGYPGKFGGPLATFTQQLLSGPLAPVRNVWKFEPLILLPICLGIAEALGAQRSRRNHLGERRFSSVRPAALLNIFAMIIVVVALIVSANPFLTQRFFPYNSFATVPSYWQQTASWLSDHGGASTSLLVPGSPASQYDWGYSGFDEPMQWLATSNWAIRSQIPDSSVGNIVMQDTVDAALRSGLPVKGLSTYLAQAGVKYVVDRTNIDPKSVSYSPPLKAFATLTKSDGFRLVRGFGPIKKIKSGKFIIPLRANLIFEVTSAVNEVQATSVANSVLVSGNPNALFLMNEQGLDPGTRAVVLAGDQVVPSKNSTLVVTDTTPRVGVSFGGTVGNISYILQPDQNDPVTGATPVNWNIVPGLSAESYVEYSGIKSVSSSSFGSNYLFIDSSAGPWAAFDNSSDTSWIASSKNNSQGQWVEINFNRKTDLSTFTVQLKQGPQRPRVIKLKISTQQGSVVRSILPSNLPQKIAAVPGQSTWMRITFADVKPALHNRPPFFGPIGAGIRNVVIPGVKASRTLITPTEALSQYESANSTNPLYLFNAGIPDHLYGPLEQGGDSQPQLSRTFSVPKTANYLISGSIVARAGPQLGAYLKDLGLKALSRDPFILACGKGPSLNLDGRNIPLVVSGSYYDLTNFLPLKYTTCNPGSITPLSAGQHVITTEDGGYLKISNTNIVPAVPEPLGPVATTRATQIGNWSSNSRTLNIGSGPLSYLIVKQNYNTGWEAVLNNKVLKPARINGWEQAWIVPSGRGGTVTLNYAPNRPYQAGLIIGAVFASVLVILCLLPIRRKGEEQDPVRALPSISVGMGLVIAALALYLVSGILVGVLIPIFILAWFTSTRRLLPFLAAASFFATAGVILSQRNSQTDIISIQFSTPVQIFAAISVGVIVIIFATAKWDRPKRSKRESPVAEES